MTKYKNKDGIELNYVGDDSQSKLTREVVGEAIQILGEYNRMDLRSCEYALHRGVNFLKENFDIEDCERSDKWRINQFNRNRIASDQVSTIEELEKRINEISNS